MRWQPLGIVYHLLKKSDPPGKAIPWVQKTLSLANDALLRRGEVTPYSFVIFRGSVYSADLEDDVQEGLSLGLFELHPAPGGYGCLVVGDDAVLRLADTCRDNDHYQRSIDPRWEAELGRVLGFVSGRSLPEIDKLSLASWFLARGYPGDKAVKELYTRRRWTLTLEGAEKVVDEAREWLG